MGKRLVDGRRVPRWWHVKPKRGERPSVLYVGSFGDGKTLQMSSHALEAMRDRLVCSNWPVVNPFTGYQTGLMHSWVDFWWFLTCRDLATFRKSLFIDEANIAARSRFWSDMHAAILDAWDTHRHYNAEVCFSVQHENDIDVAMRRKVQLIRLCTGPQGYIMRRLLFFGRDDIKPSELDATRAGMRGNPSWVRFPAYLLLHGYNTHHHVKHWKMPGKDEDLNALPLTMELPTVAADVLEDWVDPDGSGLEGAAGFCEKWGVTVRPAVVSLARY